MIYDVRCIMYEVLRYWRSFGFGEKMDSGKITFLTLGTSCISIHS